MLKKKRTTTSNKEPQLIINDAPFQYVESYKTLRTNFNFATHSGKSRKVLITSTLRNEGKSSVAINLAISLVQAGNKVRDCLLKTDYGMDIIAGGAIPPNPAELIASDSMKNLLKMASELYDYIICDAPPVGIITDAAALSPLCDGVLYVIRQKFANKNQVLAAISSLKTVNAKILGTVLSQYTIPKKPGKSDGSYHGYTYGYYGQNLD